MEGCQVWKDAKCIPPLNMKILIYVLGLWITYKAYHFIILMLFHTKTEIEEPSLPGFVSHAALCITVNLHRSWLRVFFHTLLQRKYNEDLLFFGSFCKIRRSHVYDFEGVHLMEVSKDRRVETDCHFADTCFLLLRTVI